jgi:hypothetical protein
MPIDKFVSPGAMATEAIFQALADREARRRQEMLDTITRQKGDDDHTRAQRENQMAFEQLAIQQQNAALAREQAEGLKAQREAQAEATRQKRALGVIATLNPEQNIDPETAKTIREGGMGALVGEGAVSQGAFLGDDETGVPQYEMKEGALSFKGTPQQRAMSRLMQSPAFGDKPYLKDLIEAGVIDDTAIARLLEDKTGRLFRVGRNGSLMVQDPTTGQFRATTGADAAFSKDRDQFVQEPAPQQGGVMNDARKVATFNQIAGSYERSPLIRASDRTIILKEAADSIEKDPGNAANQLNLAYSYIQALDTYQSAVREGELQNLGTLGTKLQQLAVEANKVATTGAFMPPEVAKEIARSAKQLVTTIESGRKRKEQEYASRAKVSGVGDMWDNFVGGFAPDTNSGSAAPAPSGVRRYNPATGKIE